MDNISNMMLSLISAEVCARPFDDKIKEKLNKIGLEKLFKVSKEHDLAHIVAFALEKRDLLDASPISEKFKNEHIMAFFRCQKQQFELERICSAFEKAKIKHIPLKGSVMRDYYPEDWFRTSCDIDILVQKGDVERASEVLKKELGCKRAGASRHDIAFFTDNQIKLELHYSLVADNRNYKFEQELLKVWDYAVLKENYKYRYILKDEMFYLFHIAHIAVHFKEGGCGIKPILDLYFLENRLEFEKEKRDELLEKSGLLECANAVRELSAVWFGGKEETELSLIMSRFILVGGVYGSVANRILLQNELEVGKGRYLLSRIFLPYERLKYQYPILQKYKWLYPVYTFVRWTRLIFVRGNSKRQLTELRYVNNIGNSESKELREMLKKMDI